MADIGPNATTVERWRLLPLAIPFGLLLLGFSRWSIGGAGSFLLFLAAVVLLVYVPGAQVAAWLRLADATALERIAVSVALGIPTSSAWYWVCGYFHARPLFWL